VNDTIYDASASLGEAFLEVRASDIYSVLDVVLDPTSTEVPEALRGHFDASRVGGFGHSFGGVTMARVLRDDARVTAGFIMTAPINTPILSGSPPADLHHPLFFMLAREDNSIMEIGNFFLRRNFQRANPPAWLAQVADAGHWSFSDIAGMTPAFAPGCGQGTRQTEPGVPFTYLDNDLARSIAQRYVAAFFALTLLDDQSALLTLDVATPPDIVTLTMRQ
jgi:hypothetical protein